MSGSLLDMITVMARQARIPLNLRIYGDNPFNTNWKSNSTVCARALHENWYKINIFREREIQPYVANQTQTLLTLTMFQIDHEYGSYPFARVDYQIAVPNRPVRDYNLVHSQNNILILRLWLMSVAVLTVLRHVILMVLRKSDQHRILDSLIWIVARSLGVPLFSVRTKVCTEQLFTGFVTVFGFFGGILCTGYLFDEFTDIKYTQVISTLEEFWRSDLMLVPLNYVPRRTKEELVYM